MAGGGRLTLGPALERGPAIRLTVDGRQVTAYAGETLAAVLLAEGLAATRRTRGGSPRGLYCGMGVCYDCLVVLDGVPNTRSCMTFAAEGMRVERQDGLGPGLLPSAGHGPRLADGGQ